VNAQEPENQETWITIFVRARYPYLFKKQDAPPYEMYNDEKSLEARLMTRLFNYEDKKCNTRHCFYTFRGTGHVNRYARRNAGHALYDEIIKIVQQDNFKGSNPKIRLIGFSHGGNACLHAAEKFYEFSRLQLSEKIFKVEELILVSTPILSDETEPYAQSSFFKKIYSFTSVYDNAPRQDCVSFTRFFSRKHFHSGPFEKLVEVEISVSDALNFSPTHFEFIDWGWRDYNWVDKKFGVAYRESFPLYPLPLFLFFPYIISILESIDNLVPNIIVELWPKKEKMVVYSRGQRRWKKKLPFLSGDKLDELKELIL